MQLQAVLWYIYIYNVTFITEFLGSSLNHLQPDGQPNPQYKVLDMRLQRSVSRSETAERTSGCPPVRRTNIYPSWLVSWLVCLGFNALNVRP